jgi:exopolyphosphatase / guanosine-5'-triphosphate,3'-diphosphate pyrophosphatase
VSGRLASVDIGTNSALLLIAEKRTGPPVQGASAHGCLQPVSQRIAVPRVGRNLAVTGRISEESFHALSEALRGFRAEIDRCGARLTGVVATQAFRIAANGPDLLDKVSAIMGCRARIIAGKEESRLGYLAVADRHSPAHLEAGPATEMASELAVLDIGGGSTEATRKQGGESFPIGAVNLLEALRSAGAHSEPGSDAAAFRAKAAETLRGKFAQWRKNTDVIVVGGTATALAMLELRLPGFDSEAIEGLEIPARRVSETIDLLAGLPEVAKLALPGMEKSRADILMPGLCILEAALAAIGTNRLRVSDRGVRYGVIIDSLMKAEAENEK